MVDDFTGRLSLSPTAGPPKTNLACGCGHVGVFEAQGACLACGRHRVECFTLPTSAAVGGSTTREASWSCRMWCGGGRPGSLRARGGRA